MDGAALGTSEPADKASEGFEGMQRQRSLSLDELNLDGDRLGELMGRSLAAELDRSKVDNGVNRGIATVPSKPARRSIVLTWGKDTRCDLGHANSDIVPGGHRACAFPTRVPGLPEDVVRVACGERYNAAITDQGELWTWGSGSDGKLGLESEADSPSPRRIRMLAAHCVRQVGARSASYAMGSTTQL